MMLLTRMVALLISVMYTSQHGTLRLTQSLSIIEGNVCGVHVVTVVSVKRPADWTVAYSCYKREEKSRHLNI